MGINPCDDKKKKYQMENFNFLILIFYYLSLHDSIII